MIVFFVVAYFTKPDDKACIIVVVKAVWGNLVPDMNSRAVYYEQFMDITSKNVTIRDWVFFKIIKYDFGGTQKNIGIRAFNHIFTN